MFDDLLTLQMPLNESVHEHAKIRPWIRGFTSSRTAEHSTIPSRSACRRSTSYRCLFGALGSAEMGIRAIDERFRPTESGVRVS